MSSLSHIHTHTLSLFSILDLYNTLLVKFKFSILYTFTVLYTFYINWFYGFLLEKRTLGMKSAVFCFMIIVGPRYILTLARTDEYSTD